MKEDASRRFNGRFERMSDPSRAMLSSSYFSSSRASHLAASYRPPTQSWENGLHLGPLICHILSPKAYCDLFMFLCSTEIDSTARAL